MNATAWVLVFSAILPAARANTVQSGRAAAPLPAAAPAAVEMFTDWQMPVSPALSAPASFTPPPQQLPAAPALARDPQTGLFGVTPTQTAVIAQELRAYYGDNLIDLAAVGSRALGRSSVLGRPVKPESDLDVAPLLRASPSGVREPMGEFLARLSAKVGLRVELHGSVSFDGTPYRDSVLTFGAGYEGWHHFSRGEAVRIPLRPPD